MTLRAYLDSLSGKKVAVLGVGVSNRPLLRLLAGSGACVTAYDRRDRAALGEAADELTALGIALSCGDGYLEGLAADVIFRTPGMRPDVPQVADAVAAGAVLTSEMEAFFEVCPCPILAITGSDGKTTTSTLIAEMLTRAGIRCHLGGNIGRPLLDIADEIAPDDAAVVELSSFQLMTMKKSASVAVVTNVAPNHLDIHRDMAEYVAQEERSHGVGEALYRVLEEILRRQNITNVNACIVYPYPESIGFHEHLGYHMAAHFTKCGYKLGQWRDMVWMEKLLGEHPAAPQPVVPVSQLDLSDLFEN